MEALKTLLLCLALPAVFMAALAVGHGLFILLLRNVSPLEVWANEQIRQIEDWQEEDDDECKDHPGRVPQGS